MLFTELIFIPFLTITFFLFYFAQRSRRSQLIILLISSFIFYAWWDIRFLGLFLILSILNFKLGHLIRKACSKKKKKTFLLIGLIVDLGVLVFFKYVNFFIDSFRTLVGNLGIETDLKLLNIIIPLGISFYTFWTLSYIIDIYWEKTEPSESLLEYLIFAHCFPHIIAGPIVRAREYLSQLGDNLYKKSNHEGVFLIVYGFIKKILIADSLGRFFVDPVFQGTLTEYSSLELILVLYCYSFQIFFDFSAYSDIAIGIGKIFGINYPINFKYPYSSTNAPEFWRKWHITLSFWLRDYLFLPISYAVMRRTKASKWMNIKIERWGYIIGMMATMLLCGLWHGANWTFVVWGGIHGLYLVVYNVLPRKFKKRKTTPRFLRVFFFFNLITLAWVFFRSPSLAYAFNYLKGITQFSLHFNHFQIPKLAIILAVSILLHYFVEPYLPKISKAFNRLHWLVHALIIFAIVYLTAYFGEKDVAYQAFIYFQF